MGLFSKHLKKTTEKKDDDVPSNSPWYLGTYIHVEKDKKGNVKSETPHRGAYFCPGGRQRDYFRGLPKLNLYSEQGTAAVSFLKETGFGTVDGTSTRKLEYMLPFLKAISKAADALVASGKTWPGWPE